VTATDPPTPPRASAATPLPPREGPGEGLPAHIDQSNLDAAGHVATDTPCDQCGYNLRTLHLTARCPECHHPVERSATCELLRYAPPAYIERLLKGVNSFLLGASMIPFAAVVIIAAPLERNGVCSASLALLGFALMCFGLFNFATRDPRPHRRESAFIAIGLRATVIAAAILAVAALLTRFSAIASHWPSGWRIDGELVGVTTFLIVTPAFAILRVGQLARRMGASQLQNGAVVGTVIIVLGAIFMLPNLWSASGTASWASSLLTLVVPVTLLFIMVDTRSKLAAALRQAEHHAGGSADTTEHTDKPRGATS
jgi:hypothetical protein